MRPSVKRMLSTLISLALLVAAAVIFFNLIQPEYAIVQEKKSKIETQKADIQTKTEIKKLILEQYAKYEKGDGARATMALSLPGSPSLDMAVNQINGIAEQSGLSVNSISFSDIAPSASQSSARQDKYSLEALITKPRTVSLNVSMSGQYPAFRKFLSRLENNTRIFDVKDMSLQPGPSANPSGSKSQQPVEPTLSYTLTLLTYYQGK